MVIGEGPGAQEDEQGLPFVGRSGQLLDRMLESVGINSNRDAYVCNIVKCRPPENRKPTALEMAACRPWLDQQIQLVNPAVILLAGATAVEGLLGIKGGISKLRGQWRQEERGLPAGSLVDADLSSLLSACAMPPRSGVHPSGSPGTTCRTCNAASPNYHSAVTGLRHLLGPCAPSCHDSLPCF